MAPQMKQDIVITRIIDAPLEKVWQYWTDPEMVKKWWGPKDYISNNCVIDLREGGKYLFAMTAPAYQGGQESYTAGEYLKIVPMEHLEFTQGLADKDGNRIDPTSIGMPKEFPAEIRTVVTFKAIRPDMTEITIIEHDWPAIPMAVFALAGMHQLIDKMAIALK